MDRVAQDRCRPGGYDGGVRRNLPIWLTVALTASVGAFAMWWIPESSVRKQIRQAMESLTWQVFSAPPGWYSERDVEVCIVSDAIVSDDWPIVMSIWPAFDAYAYWKQGIPPLRPPHWIHVHTDGDAADLYFRITGKKHPTLKGELSQEYRAFLEGKG